MALHHAEPGEIISVRPLGEKLGDSKSTTLLRSEHLQVFRVILCKDEVFSDHAVPGEITVQCLEGLIEFHIGDDNVQQLAAGDLLYLNGEQPHALKALEACRVSVVV